MSTNAYLILILALLVAHWVLELIVETLNLRHADPVIPAEFADCYDAERYAKAQRYLRETTRFGLLQSTLMLPVTIAFILLGGFTWLYVAADAAAPNSTILQGLVFAGSLTLLGNMLSRRHEYAADAFAARTTGQPEAMIAALKQLSAHNLSNLTPHPLKVFLEYSHPPVLQRLAALRDIGSFQAGRVSVSE